MRGRPAGRVTERREQIAAEVKASRDQGRPVIKAQIGRKFGIENYRNVRRIIRDCERLGLI